MGRGVIRVISAGAQAMKTRRQNQGSSRNGFIIALRCAVVLAVERTTAGASNGGLYLIVRNFIFFLFPTTAGLFREEDTGAGRFDGTPHFRGPGEPGINPAGRPAISPVFVVRLRLIARQFVKQNRQIPVSETPPIGQT
jgi:hypothetical protein